MTIKTQVEQGVYLKDITAELDVHPKTVRRALDRGGPPSGKRPRAHKSKLDPYKGHINKRLEDKVWNAVVIFRKISETVDYGSFSKSISYTYYGNGLTLMATQNTPPMAT